jgi:hypothetical protein
LPTQRSPTSTNAAWPNRSEFSCLIWHWHCDEFKAYSLHDCCGGVAFTDCSLAVGSSLFFHTWIRTYRSRNFRMDRHHCERCSWIYAFCQLIIVRAEEMQRPSLRAQG